MTEPKEDRGFQRIGSLLPRIVRSEHPSGSSTSGQSPTNLPTTGDRSRASEASSSTGRQLSVIDCEKWRAEITGATTETEATASLDRLCAALLGSRPVWQRAHRFGTDDQYEVEITDIRLPATLTQVEIYEVWKALEPLCRPATGDAKACQQIVSEVARLFAVTPTGRDKIGNDDLAMDTIAMDLAEYPADCALRALRAARRGDRWRPSLSQIIDDVRWRAARRSALRAAFREAGVA